MRVAVVGATGQIGSGTVTALEARGHEVVRISRSNGVDVYSGSGLAEALEGVHAVVDATNTAAQNEAEIVDFFGTTARNLVDAAHRAGVGHYVLLSIVGIDRDQRAPHYSGKREQERVVSSGPVPFTIVRATQFHNFAEMVVGWTTQDGVAHVPPLLMQPIAMDDVADILAEVAVESPLGATIDIAGPQTQDLVDMARRGLAARGQEVTLVPTWRGIFDTSMAGEALLPGPDARIAPTSFETWLAADVQAGKQ